MVENHKIVTMEHEIRVDGHYLSEKKQKIVIEFLDSEDCKLTTIVAHLRVIDDRCFKVTETFKGDESPVRTEETELTEDEIKEFEEKWLSLWNPRITKKEILNLQ